jgi:hypothetical protein
LKLNQPSRLPHLGTNCSGCGERLAGISGNFDNAGAVADVANEASILLIRAVSVNLTNEAGYQQENKNQERQ